MTVGGEVAAKLERNEYPRGEVDAVAKDVRLVWRNCRSYNAPNSYMWHAAVCAPRPTAVFVYTRISVSLSSFP